MEEFRVITSSPRTEGDGMESSNDRIPASGLDFGVNLVADELTSLEVTPSKNPERVINLIPQTTALPSTSTKSTNVSQSEKKPKFVPYEPYKAAVNPIIPIKKKGKIQKIQSHVASEFPSQQQHTTTSVHQVDSSPINKELEQMRKEKEELESQLKIYSRVNEELKRMLVASMGEDMEARVHFLTEDKIKLGDDIRQYVEQIAVDFEKKEKLSIEADIWRSKFLASSVIVEDLTKWKAALMNRNEELQSSLQSLFDETHLLHQSHQQTLLHMHSLGKAFDPLASAGGRVNETTSPIDIMGTSKLILNLAVSLCKRLLGAYNQVKIDQPEIDYKNPHILSSAQLGAHKMLSKHPIGSCTMSEIVREVTAHQVSALAHRSLNKSFYTCCNHCSGDIQTI